MVAGWVCKPRRRKMSRKSLLLVLFTFLMSLLEPKLEGPKWICKYLLTCTRQYHIKFLQEHYSWCWMKWNSHDFLDFWISSTCDKFIYFSSFYGRGRVFLCIDPLSANPTKWSNTLKQFVGKLPRNCLSVFDHFCEIGAKRVNPPHLI